MPQPTTHLKRTFNQSLQLGYCSTHFCGLTAVILRNPAKDGYTVPKFCRPIVLMNAIGNIMDVVMTQRLNYLAETYHVLPPTHIGGRKMRSTGHALHAIISKIHEARNQKISPVASPLLLDVSSALDNVLHTHGLRKRSVDQKTVTWGASFLSSRHTNIVIDGSRSTPYQINTVVHQGSPLYTSSIILSS